MNIQQHLLNNKCRTILHKILITRVTIGFTEIIQDITGVVLFMIHPDQEFSLGDPTKLSRVGFPSQSYTFALTFFNSRNYSSQCFRSDDNSLKNLSRLRLVRWPHLLSLNSPRPYASGCAILKLFHSTRLAISLRVMYLNEHHDNSSRLSREFLDKFENCYLNGC